MFQKTVPSQDVTNQVTPPYFYCIRNIVVSGDFNYVKSQFNFD